MLRLVHPISGRGHHLYTDNFYTSPALYSELQRLGFEACGTLRLNRRGVPPEAKSALSKGESRTIPVEDTMKVVQWHDKRVVSILTTVHSASPVAVERRSRRASGGREQVEKPEAIVEYNKYMGGVDKGDQLLSYYGFPHRTVKWWKRAFYYLLDVAIINSYILYCKTVKGRHLTHEQYRISLAKQLLKTTAVTAPVATSSGEPQPTPAPLQRRRSVQPLARLTERHFPEQIGRSATGSTLQRNCIVCSNKRGRGRRTTTFKCKQCDAPMCIVPCFELHHTKIDPQRYL